MKVYYDHSFPSHWISGQFNRLIIDNFVSQLPDWMDDTLIMDPGYGKIEDTLNCYPDFDAKHKIAMCFNDTYSLCKDKADVYLGEGQYNVISLANYQQFWYCGFCSNIGYRKYKNKNFPLDLKYLFLNYNRKPKPQRVQLINLLKRHKLFERGLVTLGAWDGTETPTIDIPENNNVSHRYDFKFHSIPNDLTTLGNLKVWQQSFINVVSETSYGELFLSEKSAKPLAGKRPFIINGPPGAIALLRSWGFQTFSKYWDESYDEHKSPKRQDLIIKELNKLNKLSEKQLLIMYHDMRDILEHNHNHFFGEFHKANLKGLHNMANKYIEHFFGGAHEL
jgi:hypothetical protein